MIFEMILSNLLCLFCRNFIELHCFTVDNILWALFVHDFVHD